MDTMAAGYMNGGEGQHSAPSETRSEARLGKRRRRAAKAKHWSIWDVIPTQKVVSWFLLLAAALYGSGWLIGPAKQSDVDDLTKAVTRMETEIRAVGARVDTLRVSVEDYREQVVRVTARDEMRNSPSAAPLTRVVTKRVNPAAKAEKGGAAGGFLGNLLGN